MKISRIRQIIKEELSDADLTRPKEDPSKEEYDDWINGNDEKRAALGRSGNFGDLTKKAIKSNDTYDECNGAYCDFSNDYKRYGFISKQDISRGYLTKKAITDLIWLSKTQGVTLEEILKYYYSNLDEWNETFPEKMPMVSFNNPFKKIKAQ